MKERILLILLTMFFTITCFPVCGAEIPEDGLKEVGRTGRYILFYNERETSIILLDRMDGYTWNSSVPEEYDSFQSSNAIFQSSMKSMFNMEYINVSAKRTGDSIQTNPLTQKAEIRVHNISNGIRILYDFKGLGISLALEVWLEDDSLNVRIPSDSIIEKDNFAVTVVELMPFFGAAQDMENGYLFYPDRSGAIHYFDEKPDRNAKQYEMYIYGSDDQYAVLDYKYSDEEQVMLPVYGIKRGDHAFLAVINEGEYDACITVSPSGNKVNLNRIYPRFTFRRKYFKAASGQIVEQGIEKEIIKTDRGVKYFFLKDENADYSGMANVYRRYLLDMGNIRNSIADKNEIPLSLDLFMGIRQKQIIFDKFVKMTTFKEAEDILKSFVDAGIKNIDVNLIGWVKGGYGTSPVHMPPERVLGGQKGLTRLLDYTKKQGIRLFLQDNYLDAFSENRGFSKKSDIVFQKNSLPVTDYMGEWFLLNPARAWTNFFNNILKTFKKYDIDGINFELFGKVIYYDYNKKYQVTRNETADYWNCFLEESSKELGYSASQGGNQYILKYADRLYEIPYKDSGYFITDKAVPFYQMVVHGCIPYSSDPGNLSDDLDRMKLKWVEYGYMPGFQLTYRKADPIKYTSYNKLFTSEYTKWIGKASDIYLEFNKRLSDVWSSFMINHEEVRNNVFAVTYENGYMVYINYNQEPVKINGYNIEGMDYLVITKEGAPK